MQLLLTRSDNTEARLQILKQPRDHYITKVVEGVASPLQAPPRPTPTREPPMVGGVALPESIQLLEAGRRTEAEGHVLEAHMERGYGLEATRKAAKQSWYGSLGILGGAVERRRVEQAECLGPFPMNGTSSK